MSAERVVSAQRVHKSYGHTPVLTGIYLQVAPARSAA